jgi:hypothetical protein
MQGGPFSAAQEKRTAQNAQIRHRAAAHNVVIAMRS